MIAMALRFVAIIEASAGHDGHCAQCLGEPAEIEAAPGVERFAAIARRSRGLPPGAPTRAKLARTQLALTRKRKNGGRVEKELVAQIRCANDDAFRPDDLLVEPGDKRADVKGRGMWKRCSARGFCRMVFAPPSANDTALAREKKTTHGYVAAIRQAGCSMCWDIQSQHVQSILENELGENDFVIHTIMFDETELYVKPSDAKANTCSVLAMHAYLTLGQNGRTWECEVHLPPGSIENKTAESIWEALTTRSPVPLLLDRKSARFLALNFGSDHHKANLRLIDYAIHVAPDWLLILPGLCKQHGTGLCLAPVIKEMNIISGAFCIVKQLHQGTFYNDVVQAVFDIVERDLEWIREEDDPDFKPDAEVVASNARLLELTYYARNLAGTTVAEEDEHAAAVAEEMQLHHRT